MKLFSRSILRGAAIGAALALVAGASQAADITGAGATFPAPVYAKWADTYKKESGVGLNYQAIGSGGGINQIKAKTVTFGASDMPLKAEDLDAAGLVQFPMVMGGVVPVVNIPGVEPGKLVLDGDTIAEIYLGEITKWDDAKIKKLNPDLTLPSADIAPAYRADGSGTTFLFTNYLSAVNAKFKDSVGASTSVQWPTGIGGKGNAGVAGAVQQTEGGIGYVEYAYVKQNKLTYAKMVNHDGKTLEPTLKTFQAAAANADWANAKNYFVILTNQPGAESWPITGASFILMYKQPQDPAAAATALQFFAWAYAKGVSDAEGLDYVPMPKAVVDMVHKTWNDNIKGADGKAIWTASK
ncbi:phosphate ABC transporter substrate-binding protein PstS [Inquilinus limosus]|uniref:Phosphate-binding protein PstS n=1 Tax=Inquilinus limosus TaxID=171674 RepID=A0A211Z1G0_9PROT|nr:phosphate ABC transporter substrate-binding protein PstS [Inquilinus limosus]OWJ59054.1 phosphate ABC transporter substrate-binding protein PstS [Inquilinus limosus]